MLHAQTSRMPTSCAKVRDAELLRLPYMLVVGDREAEQGTVAVRHRVEGDLGPQSLEDFLLRLSLESRPRATCALCLIQDDAAFFAHVGDSRIYHLRNGAVRERTRDHSHVELLLRAGRITERQAQDHPMRNYVECCIGGDPVLPEMSLSGRNVLKSGDVVMLCSDGLWSGLTDEQIAALSQDPEPDLRESLAALGQRSLLTTAPYADNTTAAAVRWLGP